MKNKKNIDSRFVKKFSVSNITVFFIVSLLPLSCFAAGGGLPNPLGPGGPKDIPSFLNSLFGDIVKIGAVVLAFYIVYSGYLFVSAQGNEQTLQKAKDSFKWVLIGGAILLGAQVLSSAILETITTIGP